VPHAGNLNKRRKRIVKKQGLIAGFALAAAMAVGAAAFAADTPAAIGEKVSDGSVYAGISPSTHTPMYTTPADAPGPYTWDQGKAYCKMLDTAGHKDWRLPTGPDQGDELNVLFQNRVAIGVLGFHFWNDSNVAGIHWSAMESQQFPLDAWVQDFGRKGTAGLEYKGSTNWVRCVRTEPAQAPP
jgi:hypothetical protein